MAKKALLGYMAIEVVNLPCGIKWGAVNNRPLDLALVEKLVKRYESNLSNCHETTVMWGMVKKSWVENIDKWKDNLTGLDINKLPLLELTIEGKKEICPDNLWMFSGNHQCAALVKFVDNRRKKLEECMEQTPMDTAFKKKESQDIDMNFHWVVKLYDRGEWTLASVNERAW